MINFSELSALEISSIVLILFVVAFGVWIFLYLNYYSDWFYLRKKKTLKRKAILDAFIKNLLIRVEHLLGNLDEYSSKMLLAEAEYAIKIYMIKAYNLEETNFTLIDTFEKIEKKGLEDNNSLLKKLKNVIEQYKTVGFSSEKVSKEELRKLYQEITEFFMQKRKALQNNDEKESALSIKDGKLKNEKEESFSEQ